MKKTISSIILVLLVSSTVIAGELTMKVRDTANDPADVDNYIVYMGVGEGVPVDILHPAVGVEGSENFTINFADGDCYTLSATAFAVEGIESPRCRELEVCFDAAGNPTYPGGPLPPDMIIVIP